MNVNHISSLVAKDMNVFLRKKTVLYTVVLLPLALGIGFPALLNYMQSRKPLTAQGLNVLMPTFSFFYVILASIAPVQIATYSLIGEKIEKSIEPLLATPITDNEILLGKSLIAFVPSIIAIYISASIFTILIDNTVANLPYLLPDWTFGFILVIMVPLTLLFSIEVGIIVSSRVNDARSGSQLGMLFIIPFVGIYLGSELSVITLDQNTMYAIAGVLLLVDIVLFFISKFLFQREQILTNWK